MAPKIVKLQDFLKRKYSFRYVIDPLLTVGGIGLIHGKGGHGKTQWAFTLADAVASGGKFLGQFPTKQGRVLYLQLDMPESLFQERWQKAAKSLKAPENIAVIPYKPMDILEPEFQTMLKRLVTEYDPTLVIIDTLRKVHYEDENDNAVPMQVYAAIKDCIGENRSAIIIHHDRKSTYVNNKSKKDTEHDDYESPDEFVETFRGARAWIDDCDLGVHLYKYGRTNRIKMSYSKLRCKPQAPMFLLLNEKSLLIDPKPAESVREFAVKIQTAQPKIDPATWVKEVQKEAKCSRQRAHKVVAEIITEMTF